MRVFISSTVFDLLDVRAELGSLLQSLGVSPVLSDDKLSDFRVTPSESSIETCLANVASCDEVIIILDRRYGFKLGASGFDDVSATHLEYRKAFECKIPIHFYLRDRLEADFSVWKRNKRLADLVLPWVKPADFGLFELIEEHSRLEAGGRSNWRHVFSNSLDLKAAISNHFKCKLLPSRLVEAIEKNRFPLLHAETTCTQEQFQGISAIKLTTTVTNVGGAPAFNCLVKWQEEAADDRPRLLFAPGQSLVMTYLYTFGPRHIAAEQILEAQYESPLGVAVSDSFRVGVRIVGNAYMGGSSLTQRRYRRTGETVIEIDD